MSEKFDAVVWAGLAGSIADAMGLTKKQEQALVKDQLARLIASTGYEAHFENPDRYAVANVSQLLLARKLPEIFGHRGGETIENRMATASIPQNLSAEDKVILDYILAQVYLLSLEDHFSDRVADAKIGKNNPINNGLDYTAKKKELTNKADKLKGTLDKNGQSVVPSEVTTFAVARASSPQW